MLQDHFYRKKMGSWWRMRLYLKKELAPYESIPKDAKLKKTKKEILPFKKSWLRFVFATGMETGESGSITYREDL